MKVQFYTLAPSPHLVGVLDELYQRPTVDLHVLYERKWLDERSWGLHPGEAPHTYLNSWDVTGRGQHVSPSLWRMGADTTPDVAIVNTSYVSPNTYALVHWLTRQNIPFVFWAERVSRLSSAPVKRVRRSLLRWILHRATGFVGPTEDTIQFYRSSLGYEGPATWVPYHRDLSPFLELPTVDSPTGRLCFLVLGTLSHGKGIDTVLRALADVDRSAELLVVGEGPQRSDLKGMAGACRPPHRVRFEGRVPYEQVPDLMRKADVLLFPSRHDGFGMVTMEALAAGRPVVASSSVMSAHQYIRSGENGWLIPPDDVSAWQRRIEAIIQDGAQLPQWGRAARRTICSAYDIAQDVSRLVDFLDDLLSRTSSPASSSGHE